MRGLGVTAAQGARSRLSCTSRRSEFTRQERSIRTWKKPEILDVAVGLEINAYAAAAFN